MIIEAMIWGLWAFLDLLHDAVGWVIPSNYYQLVVGRIAVFSIGVAGVVYQFLNPAARTFISATLLWLTFVFFALTLEVGLRRWTSFMGLNK